MIYIAEYKGYENNEHIIEITDKVVSRDEYDSFFSNFTICGQIHQFKEIYEICLESNNDLERFMAQKNLNELLRAKEMEAEKVLQTGNKLLLNYCTVIKIMVEKIESYLTHNKPDKLDEFKKLCSGFYDSNFAYRFFMRLRDYIIHNGMPFTKIDMAVYKNCGIYIDRNHLLKWSGWSTVKKDLENLPQNDISIQPFLKEIAECIYAIYLQGLYYLASDVFKSLKNIEEFHQRYNVKRFDFIEMNLREDFGKGKYEYHVVPMESMIKCMDEINKHPSINIIINKK